MPRAKPPADPKARFHWDNQKHWERTFYQREIVHGIIPDFVQHYRPMLIQTFRKQGHVATERLLTEMASDFNKGVKEGHMTSSDAKGIIENLTSFVKTLNEMKKKKQKAKLDLLKKRKK